MTVKKAELKVVRAVAHLFQATLISGPERSVVNHLQQSQLAVEWPEIGCNGRRLEQGLKLLGTYLKEWKGSDTQIEALKLDHGRLFLGPGEPLAAPWGSVYLEALPSVNGESTLAFSDFLRVKGIQITQKTNEPLDHIGTQFAVLSFLLGKLAEQPDSTETTAVCKSLLADHLLPWADRCLERVEEFATTHYYRGLAILAREYLCYLRRVFDIRCITVPLFR